IDQQKIYFDNSSNMYVVPSANMDELYIVDLSVGTCTCLAVLGETPCKYQAAVAIKYQAGSFNFISALSLKDCATYRYI
ncbi:14496_t:CDS:1, partial [Racocetra persica]